MAFRPWRKVGDSRRRLLAVRSCRLYVRSSKGNSVRLGFILTPGLVNSLYRVAYPMSALERCGHEIVWPEQLDDDAPMRELLGCDLVHCFRRPDRTADLELLARHGVAISVDNDDDLGELDVYEGIASLAARRAFAKYAVALAKQARQADIVTTPSSVIAGKYEAAGVRNVAMIENYLDPNLDCFGHRSRHNGVVVGWVAGTEHAVDVKPLRITEVLTRLLEVHDDLRVVTVGVKLDLPRSRYEHVQRVDNDQLLKVISRWDIGIAPLTDTSFNRARSNVKLKEYGAGGVAWLASPVIPYLDLGPNEGGELVSDDRWFDALDRLIASPRKRRRFARRASKWAKRQTMDRHAGAWEIEFQRAIAVAATRRTARHAAGAV